MLNIEDTKPLIDQLEYAIKDTSLYRQMIDDGFEFEFKPRPDLINSIQMQIFFTASNGKRYMQSFILDKDACSAPSFDLTLYYDSLKMTREKREKQIKEAANG